MNTQIRFPNLHLSFSNVPDGITIMGFDIKFYGILIAIGFMAGLLLAQWEAKRTKQDPEVYLDYLLVMVLPAIAGARLYYVIFSWEYYKEHLNEILMLRNGGLAIYGGVLAAILTLLIFCKVRKQSPLVMADTAVMGLLVGQIIGRWGNFFNREAFGGFTDGLFAMEIPVNYFNYFTIANQLPEQVLSNLSVVDGVSYISVHPTFLYEGMWNFGVLLLLLWFRKQKRGDGQMMAIYFMGYGVGRFLIEGLRTDSLYIGSSSLRASQCLALILVAVGMYFFWKGKKSNGKVTKCV